MSFHAAALQANTPEAALMEIATADKPEIIIRHLPDPIKKRIEDLPKPQKQEVMQKLLEMKSQQFNECTLRPAADAESEAWEVLDSDGQAKGKVRLATAFISGLDALLPLQFEGRDGSHMFIVTMRLEGHEWRIVDFGPWDKADTGLTKLLHQPTVMEKNEASAKETLRMLLRDVNAYAARFPLSGYPERLGLMTLPAPPPYRFLPGAGALLDKSFASDPVVKDGYEFRYLLTSAGDGHSPGEFAITAAPLEFGTTGSRNYRITHTGGIDCTTENRPATDEDSCPDDD